MNTIYRQEVNINEVFVSRSNVTFGYQAARNSFSVWFDKDDLEIKRYIIIGTGFGYDGKILRLVSSVVLSDGLHVFHLCEVL